MPSVLKICSDFKGLVHPKMKIMSLITHPMSFQTRKTFVHLQNTNKDVFDEIESYLTLHRQQHNWNVPKSRNIEYIGKTVHVTSVAQLHFCYENTFYCAKKTKRTIYSTFLSPELQCLLRRLRSCSRFPSERKQCWLCEIRSEVLSKMPEDVTRGEEWLSTFFFFAKKKSILVASQNWSWATDVTWTVLPMYLLRFWTWEHFSCVELKLC